MKFIFYKQLELHCYLIDYMTNYYAILKFALSYFQIYGIEQKETPENLTRCSNRKHSNNILEASTCKN